MRFKAIILLSAASALYVLPANAQVNQPEYKSGLNYTTFKYKAKNAEQTQDTQTVAKPAAPQKTQTPKPINPAAIAPASGDESEEIRIWNKYKALAAGQGETQTGQTPAGEATEETAKATSPDFSQIPSLKQNNNNAAIKTWSAPKQPEAAPQEAKSGQQGAGITGILQNWQQSKQKQSEMRTKSFATPDGLATFNKKQQDEQKAKARAPQPTAE